MGCPAGQPWIEIGQRQRDETARVFSSGCIATDCDSVAWIERASFPVTQTRFMAQWA